MTSKHPEHSANDENSSAIVRDPVCGMTVDPDAGKPTAEHDGHTYYFCSQSCQQKFVANPDAYRTAKDPVCGMTVERATAAYMSKHEGQRFYFCSSSCQSKLYGGIDLEM